jgi:Na+/citrate or Na+/malate symporter
MVYYHWMPKEFVATATDFTKSTAFLFLFISAIIVGSIFGMDRRTLIKGFFKIVVPTALGTIVAAIVGTAVGKMVGLGFHHSFYYVVIPIMAGGVGEGAIPLSMGYATIVHQDWGAIFAQVLPPVMFGSLTAILLAGVLNFVGKKRPDLTGYGKLNPGEQDELKPQQQEIEGHMDVGNIAAAGLTTIMIYLVGVVFFRISVSFGFPIPAPVGMLFLAVAIKLTHAVSPKLQQGAFVVYKFFAIAVTYPLLFAIGVAMTPWEKLIAAFALPNLLTIVSTVVAMMATSFLTARWIDCYPIDVTIINACRCAQGGTGNVAILTASDRMQLMPFAQVATRIGGAVTVTLALLAYAKMH